LFCGVCSFAPEPPTSCGTTPDEAKSFQAINDARVSNGKTLLACDASLSETAHDRANLVCKSGKYEHPPGAGWEIIAWTVSVSAESAVNLWLASTHYHREILLSPFDKVGVGRRRRRQLHCLACDVRASNI